MDSEEHSTQKVMVDASSADYEASGPQVSFQAHLQTAWYEQMSALSHSC